MAKEEITPLMVLQEYIKCAVEKNKPTVKSFLVVYLEGVCVKYAITPVYHRCSYIGMLFSKT